MNIGLAFAISVALLAAGVAAAQTPPLLTRDQLGAPERSAGAISPDGTWLAFVGLDEGTPNIFIAPRGDPLRAEAVTHDRSRGIREFWFAYDSRHLLFTQDNDGDENNRLFALDLSSRQTRALTPSGVRATVDTLSPQAPGAVLVMMNDRDERYFDPVRIEIATGRVRRLYRNTEYAAFVADRRLGLRLATTYTDDGAKHWFARRGSGWRQWAEAPPEDALTSTILGFAADNETLFMADSRDRDTAAIFAVNARTHARAELAADSGVDLNAVLAHPTSGQIQAVVRNDVRSEWLVLDQVLAPDFEVLHHLADGEPFFVDSRTLNDDTWVVRVTPSDGSARTYLYDRATRRAALWFDANPGWQSLDLQQLHAAAFESRDGLRLSVYYMLPPGSDPDGDGLPSTPAPTILWVHGGPWDRESYGFHSLFQLYANRGYAVLSVNFRGSTGFGKRFINAANGEWGGRMQDDLLDAKAWAVRAGISLPDRIAIVGGSYGGYAALAGMALTPGEFACGISVAGPSSLMTLMSTIPEYWISTRALYETRVGDPDTTAGRTLLESRSPLNAASHIRGALLIGQGANDPRVPTTEAEQMVRAMQANGAPVTYVLFPDEGHGFQREENDRAFSAVTEEFLARCLGGRFQAIGRDFEGSSITVPVGAEHLPGVARALPRLQH